MTDTLLTEAQFAKAVTALADAMTIDQLRESYRGALKAHRANPTASTDESVRVFIEAGKLAASKAALAASKAAFTEQNERDMQRMEAEGDREQSLREAVEIDVPDLTDRHRSFLEITKQQGSVHPSELATDNQIRFVRRLLAERDDDGADIEAAITAGTYTKRDASDDIERLKSTKPTVARPATERQVEYLTALLGERVHQLNTDDLLDAATHGQLSFDDASANITALKGMPRNTKKADHGIRQGHYAVSRGDDIEAGFYRVSPTGRIYVLAGPQEHPYNGKLNAELEWIRDNTREAASLYGQLIGRCGRCHLRLTDDVSRGEGIGPICRTKSDW